MTTAILSLIISVLAIGLCVGVLKREREAGRELDGIIEDIRRELENPAKEEGISPEKEIMTYDRKRDTIVVNGNIEARGYVSAGNMEE